ncbi:hypothetical protein FH063_001847 [Azospirillum argentinense]|uniref:Uncharacterized protein n=1 Tax=Azospirillum argentinense TaxID=2970906 RepID=A0A5B0L073_9PROT|nr:hypothetical protein FH063_001847 [Azospirillum argentinense]
MHGWRVGKASQNGLSGGTGATARVDEARTIRPPGGFAYAMGAPAMGASAMGGEPGGLPSPRRTDQPTKNGCVPCAAMAFDSRSSAWA